MNIRRFIGRTSRDALGLAREALGDDAVVLSTKPSTEGVEVLAMAPEGMQQIEKMTGHPDAAVPPAPTAPATRAAAPRQQQQQPAAVPPPVQDTAADVAQLSMSTLSFQDYVRERMLRRRQEALSGSAPAEQPAAAPAAERAHPIEQRMNARAAQPAAAGAAPLRREPPVLQETLLPSQREAAALHASDLPLSRHAERAPQVQAAARIYPTAPAAPSLNAAPAAPRHDDMLAELRAMKGLIEERFGALAYIEKLNRQPGQVRLIQKLLDAGFSPALIKKIGDSLPMDVADEAAWAAGVLERNLITAEAEAPLEDQGGVYALVGATGVGKTTTTAKIAAAFAARYGAANLGLITLDAYRIGAHEQLRAYGRILGVPVHTAHDRASLEDLLELLAGKKMVLIDTAGMAQRDTRTRELLEMVSHRSVRKLLVINAASQGETIEDVMIAYHAQQCAGIVLSKMDEAVKLGPALDAAIRLKLKIVGVANGQRVPEDWHRLDAAALVARAMRAGGSSAYRLDASDVSLVLTAPIAARGAASHDVRPPLRG